MHQISVDWWHESRSHKSRRGGTFWRWLLRDTCCSCRVPRSAGVDSCLAVCLQLVNFHNHGTPYTSNAPVLQALPVINQRVWFYISQKVELSFLIKVFVCFLPLSVVCVLPLSVSEEKFLWDFLTVWSFWEWLCSSDVRKVSHYSWDDSEDFMYCFISADRSAWVTVSYLSTLSPSSFFFICF